MKSLQNFYGVSVLPARPLSPKDKGSVERAVAILESDFIMPNAGTVFDSFADLNRKVAAFLDDLNNRKKAPEGVSRWDLYKRHDLPVMRPLPEVMCPVEDITVRKVPRNCHVAFDSHYYSVPYIHVGKEVLVKVTSERIVICTLKAQVIADHKRSYDPWKRYVTIPDHLKSNYRAYTEMASQDSEYFLRKAENIGEHILEFITCILHRSDYPEQEYRSCQGILRLCTKQPHGLADRAAADCIEHHDISYSGFQGTLKKLSVNNDSSSESKTEEKEIPEHKNIRGKGYYR